MKNIKAIIKNHNMNILHQNNEIKDECNYRNKKYCPLGGKCLSPNIVYQGKNEEPYSKSNLEHRKRMSTI